MTPLRFLSNGDHLFGLLQKILPVATHEFHKGLCGRIGVIGGSFEYTGAPYYSGISALKTGADLSYVFCASDAAIPIKSYSPELIVLPILDSSEATQNVISTVIGRLHAVVLGPGLGRNPSILPNIRSLVAEVKRNNIPIIVDADGLHFVNEEPSLVKNYKRAILTPNIVEFRRMFEKLTGKAVESNEMSVQLNATCELAESLGCTIVRKGHEDIISDGIKTIICDLPGSVRRCGGQGDLLSGSMGTFATWAFSKEDSLSSEIPPPMLAALAACLLTRKSNELAYARLKQSMLTTDMISEIGNAFNYLFNRNH